ncbi:unnamed protein product [Caenorhabditis bovis]|uniref:C6 domain-containing protein n=1 Tax=Caenorhabditis bovis TaxID=2654633 RepID=A0A8S1EQ73_9PELO|nr:unnamed protein product [Caenorhabditis bovis]
MFILLPLVHLLPNVLGCVSTIPITDPVITTTTISPGCCPELTQTLTSSEFPDGTMTFSYNNDASCRMSVTVTCSSSDPSFGLYAAIVANQVNYLDYGPTSVSFNGVCNAQDMSWYMGDPALRVETLECILTNPP